MDKETKQFLEEQFAKMATKEDLVALETRIATNVGEMINGLATHLDERFEELAPTIRDVESHEKRIKFLEDRLPKLAKA